MKGASVPKADEWLDKLWCVTRGKILCNGLLRISKEGP